MQLKPKSVLWLCIDALKSAIIVYHTSIFGMHNQSCMGSVQGDVHACSIRISLHYTCAYVCICDILLFTHCFVSLLYFIILFSMHMYLPVVLRMLYNGKVMYMFLVSILYVVYSVVVVDLLCRVQLYRCTTYVRVCLTFGKYVCILNRMIKNRCNTKQHVNSRISHIHIVKWYFYSRSTSPWTSTHRGMVVHTKYTCMINYYCRF
jgi:hypothetical protein